MKINNDHTGILQSFVGCVVIITTVMYLLTLIF